LGAPTLLTPSLNIPQRTNNNILLNSSQNKLEIAPSMNKIGNMGSPTMNKITTPSMNMINVPIANAGTRSSFVNIPSQSMIGRTDSG
jgi:hypothetical protein